ncbi:unnamed protein product [Ambrosiozyma monospora]|uniref:Unnamed protein product n=1 Tax=Ambrosiozyma monospora TaxID=43982 RepID=A0A9W6Z2A2_AMBMO|nr:unnamed protein product [Ambrosiozyma monospora]
MLNLLHSAKFNLVRPLYMVKVAQLTTSRFKSSIPETSSFSQLNLSDINIISVPHKETEQSPITISKASTETGKSKKSKKKSRSKLALQINSEDKFVGASEDIHLHDTPENDIDTDIDVDNEMTSFYQHIQYTINQYSCDQTFGSEFVILFQVGSFYELYFSQASKYANLLGLTLTSKKLKNQSVPFAGFPDYRLEKYLQLIFNLGFKAIICDQRQDLHTNLIERPINRLVTPGTIIDEVLRDYHRNNFLVSVFVKNSTSGSDPIVSLCICDTLLGTFKTSECSLPEMMLEITKTNPSEIVLLDAQYQELSKQFPDMQQYYITRLGPNHISQETIDAIQLESDTKKRTKSNKLTQDIAVLFEGTAKQSKSYIKSLSHSTLGSAFILYNYLKECLPFNHNGIFYLPSSHPSTSISTTTSTSTQSTATSMHIDQTAAQDLELISTIRGGFKVGALANTIDRTVTTAGARLLNRWILEPSVEPRVIGERQKLVSGFLADYETSLEIVQLLKRTGDVPRIVRRVGNGRVELAELRELAGIEECVDATV